MTVIRIAAVSAVAGYVRLRYRIRGYGHLPDPRGATLVIANAQTEADDTAMVPLLSFDGSVLDPISPVASRRLFEPGFLAVRIPWLSRLLYAADLSALFSALAINPLENEIYARPLRSVATALRAEYAATPLRDVLSEAARERLGIGDETVDDAFRWQTFRKAAERVRLREVRDPYRARILAAMRARHDADVARLLGILDAGGTLYLIPEGRFRVDGRIGRFGGVIDRLAPHAHVVTCGISYDPFRSGRLSFLYRLVPPLDPGDLPNSLRAARPVTISQILAHLLHDRAGAFTLDEISSDAAACIRSLPGAAFRDPEIAPATTLDDALGAMVRLGILAHDGSRYRVTERSDRPPLANLHDQATFFAETIEAAERLQPSHRPVYSSPSK
jgi:hypothetical protein